MNPSRHSLRRGARRQTAMLAAALVALLVVLPAVAHAATPGNPQVLRIDPTTGDQTVLAGGSPWTTLGGIAVGPSGTLYVANQGPIGPNPQGAGIYALTAPGFAVTPVATTAPTAAPTGLVASGSTLYSLDGTNVISISTTAPFAQQVVSSGGLYQQYGVQPASGTIVGTTLYTTAWGSCQSVGGGGAYVIAVNLATGQQTLTKNLGCASLGGIAATAGGNLLVAEASTNTLDGGPAAPAKIVQINPATGVVTTVSTGGSLKTPQGIALNAAGDLVVADSTSGVIAVSIASGQQSPLAAGGHLGGATGVAIGSGGAMYVSEAGVPPTLKASAPSRQAFSSAGIRLTASCNRTCTVGYDAAITIKGGSGFAQDAAFPNVRSSRTLRIKLPEQVNARIARALRAGRPVTAKLTITPQDPRTSAPGRSTTLTVRLTRASR